MTWLFPMGCKFSIQVDQPRNKTPRVLDRKRSSSVQTGADTPDKEELFQKTEEEPKEELEELEAPDKEQMSSPDQAKVKALSREYRHSWKP